MKTVKLSLPAGREDLARLELGTVVYLSGRLFTGREGVYRMAVEDKRPLPPDIGSASFHCSPAAAINPDGSYSVGAVTATASFRFAKWIEPFLALTGCTLILGKGGMSSAVYRESFVPHGAIYLTTVGYGTGALLGRGIKRVVAAHWVEELGLAQAIWVLDVAEFGPFLVESDAAGNSLFERENARIAPGFGALYGATRPPALHRFGETDRPEDELI